MCPASQLFTQALFRLAANPQYIEPLREEVEGIVEKYGWSKVAMSKMRKVDSFLKECHRIEGNNIGSYSRIRLYAWVALLTKFISHPLSQGFKRLHVLRWNFYTERDVDCCAHAIAPPR